MFECRERACRLGSGSVRRRRSLAVSPSDRDEKINMLGPGLGVGLRSLRVDPETCHGRLFVGVPSEPVGRLLVRFWAVGIGRWRGFGRRVERSVTGKLPGVRGVRTLRTVGKRGRSGLVKIPDAFCSPAACGAEGEGPGRRDGDAMPTGGCATWRGCFAGIRPAMFAPEKF